ncbi:amino acid permease [Mycobacterium dioxanotrophicus]|jgi:urea carboxylase system permease|uniref:Amino acid permease n=1 Tax=Mycobacterium dioxanotrophicus TaxID=482462 RepID=A0A1Y0C8L0_9MYCO|nr:APC family permease [Mycobacterium dioxanotrophicus]ART71407.1 amino acid permease [Mycobacterium dioxanotrophicus]
MTLDQQTSPDKKAAPETADAPGDTGLEHFGYKQTLDRSIGKFASFAAGVSYISILTGTFQMFYFGYGTAGPAYLWSIPLVFVGQLMIALCFMELAAKYPIAGSVYNWSKALGTKVVGWSAGWMILTASIVTLAAVVLAIDATMPRIWSGFRIIGSHNLLEVSPSNAVLLGAILIVLTTVINALGVRLMTLINSVGVFVELCAAVVIIIVLACNIKRTPALLFHTNGYGAGVPGGFLTLFLIASIASAYIMYGFDTASSLGEETREPRKTAPTAIFRAVLSSCVLGGGILTLAVLATPDLTDPELANKAGGLQYVIESVLNGSWGKVFMVTLTVAISVCALSVHTAAIRIAFAMARDNALPFGEKLASVHPKYQTPIVPAVTIGALAIAILVMNVNQPTIFTIVTSIAVVMIYISYLLVTGPMLVQRFRGNWPPADLKAEGYFTMGRWGFVVNILAVVWGIGMGLNVAWPRPEVYGEGWYNTWGAFIYIGIIAGVGLIWYYTVGRRSIGTLRSHASESVEQAEPDAMATPGPEGI